MTQTAIESSRMQDDRPVSTLTSEGPIEFVIPGDVGEYKLMVKIYKYIYQHKVINQQYKLTL